MFEGLVSRKLVAALSSIAAIVAVVITAAVLIGEAVLLAPVTLLGVEAPVFFWALLLIAGLGGFSVLRQAQLDELEDPEELYDVGDLEDMEDLLTRVEVSNTGYDDGDQEDGPQG